MEIFLKGIKDAGDRCKSSYSIKIPTYIQMIREVNWHAIVSNLQPTDPMSNGGCATMTRVAHEHMYSRRTHSLPLGKINLGRPSVTVYMGNT